MLRPRRNPAVVSEGCRDRIREMVKTAGTGAAMVENGDHAEAVAAVRPQQLEQRTLAAVARVGELLDDLGRAITSQMASSGPSAM
jgi:hypothetical protein